MAEIQKALKKLSPIQWSDVPLDDLPSYLSDAFEAGELLCNSIPPPPDGEPFQSARPHHSAPNAANSAAEMHPSTARPFPPQSDHEELQKHWGKPMKLKNNPHNVCLHKMAGKDRHGAWFARRSVHEGMGFAKFSKAMQREFPHSLAVQGEAGAGAVRGLAADRRVERIPVEGKGKLEVYQLSAQMPKPVTPRNFYEMVMTSDNALTEKSAAEIQGGKKCIPRNFMMVSRPIDHPETDERSGFVKGQYESVELIREIPLNPATSKNNGQDGETAGDSELNPVEWIMITRSDPGGGIPRFMVERGTPDAMVQDVAKFLDWACAMDEVPDPDKDLEEQQAASKQVIEERPEESAPATDSRPNGVAAAQESQRAQKAQAASAPPPPPQDQGGIFSSVASTIGAYAPASVGNYLQPHDAQPAPVPVPVNEKVAPPEYDSDSSSTVSSDSFASANSMRRLSTAREHDNRSAEVLSTISQSSSLETGANGSRTNLAAHDKEVSKIMHQREKLDRKLAKKKHEEEEKLKKSAEKDETEQEKARAKAERDLQKAEEKHRKEVEKLEHKKEREARKAEQKRRKKDDATKLSMVARERDEARVQLDSFKSENALLLDRLEELQRENTVMANRLGKEGMLKGLQEEVLEMGKEARSSGRGASMDGVGKGSLESKR